MVRVSAGRLAAARILVDVEKGGFADSATQAHDPRSPRERGLARFLSYGVLRHRATIDAALQLQLRQPLGSLDAPVLAVLRVGAFERLYGRAKPHAVVHQAVELCRPLRIVRAKGLVNAVLRRVSLPSDLTDEQRLNHPRWLLDRWRSRYEHGAVEGWLAQNNDTPALFVVENSRAGGLAPDMLELLTQTEVDGASVEGVFRVSDHAGAVSELPGFEQGRFWVQDLSAVLMADLVQAQPGERILDACAAPGGKTFRLRAAGAEVLAVDTSSDRLDRLQENAERLGLKGDSRRHDWLSGHMEGELEFDAVLVDAPCTGLGVLGRKPEIRWRRTQADLASAAIRQQEILKHAAYHVRVGGRLVYSVCSPEPEEGQGVVDAFLVANPMFTIESTLSTAPPTQGEDAHFGALMVRS